MNDHSSPSTANNLYQLTHFQLAAITYEGAIASSSSFAKNEYRSIRLNDFPGINGNGTGVDDRNNCRSRSPSIPIPEPVSPDLSNSSFKLNLDQFPEEELNYYSLQSPEFHSCESDLQVSGNNFNSKTDFVAVNTEIPSEKFQDQSPKIKFEIVTAEETVSETLVEMNPASITPPKREKISPKPWNFPTSPFTEDEINVAMNEVNKSKIQTSTIDATSAATLLRIASPIPVNISSKSKANPRLEEREADSKKIQNNLKLSALPEPPPELKTGDTVKSKGHFRKKASSIGEERKRQSRDRHAEYARANRLKQKNADLELQKKNEFIKAENISLKQYYERLSDRVNHRQNLNKKFVGLQRTFVGLAEVAATVLESLQRNYGGERKWEVKYLTWFNLVPINFASESNKRRFRIQNKNSKTSIDGTSNYITFHANSAARMLYIDYNPEEPKPSGSVMF